MVIEVGIREVKQVLEAGGASVVGFADLAPVPEEQRRGFPRAISFGLAIAPAVVAGIADGPTAEYRTVYEGFNARLTAMAEAAAARLAAHGWRSEARPGTGDIDWRTVSAPFSHKMAATLAGLGWIGKCDLLVTPRFGSAVRWGTVLTDAPLACGTPVTESRCGDCHACVDICPGHACTGKAWRQGLAREAFWDAQACIAGMKAINARRGTSFQICGQCIAACPYTKAYVGGTAA
jgi:epoxyqueuosine reductase QueG